MVILTNSAPMRIVQAADVKTYIALLVFEFLSNPALVEMFGEKQS